MYALRSCSHQLAAQSSLHRYGRQPIATIAKQTASNTQQPNILLMNAQIGKSGQQYSGTTPLWFALQRRHMEAAEMIVDPFYDLSSRERDSVINDILDHHSRRRIRKLVRRMLARA